MRAVLAGRVTHYFSLLGVAVLDIRLPLRAGEYVLLSGHMVGFVQPVDTMQINHRSTESAESDDDSAMKVTGQMLVGDKVLLLAEAMAA